MRRLDLGTRQCLECSKIIQLKISRDIERKKFCSHSCQYKYLQRIHNLQPPKPTPDSRRKAGFSISLHMKQGLIPKPPTPTPATRKKMGLSIRGSKNGNWIKDRTQVKHSRFNCSERELNSTWRKDVFERDNFTCQKTGAMGGQLQAHHIESYASNPDLRLNRDNGITLSLEAHRKFHKLYGRDNNTREQLIEFLGIGMITS